MEHHNNPLNLEAYAHFWVEKSRFHINFHFQGKTHTHTKFSQTGYDNWGLWEYDVLELFLTRNHSHYLELQISPLKQTFALLVIEPRKTYEKIERLDLAFQVEHSANLFRVCADLAVSDIPGSSQHIQGNVHACLGPSDKRCFLGTNINSEEKVNFHRPDLFIPLGAIA